MKLVLKMSNIINNDLRKIIIMNKTRIVQVGNILIGGGNPISVQSMTNTDTRDVEATLNQIRELYIAGCEIIRCAVPDMEAAEALKEICKYSPMPVVADIHFDYRLALKVIENGVSALRLNPGNIGSIERVKIVAKAAKERNTNAASPLIQGKLVNLPKTKSYKGFKYRPA